MDANVSRGNLKNLITDKPSPITVSLAQKKPVVKNLIQLEKSDADGLFKLMDANVTRGNLKNLVTDKPSPITVGLAQTNGVPVHVNPESILLTNSMGGVPMLGPVKVGIDDINLVQTKIIPLTEEQNQPGHFLVEDRDTT